MSSKEVPNIAKHLEVEGSSRASDGDPIANRPSRSAAENDRRPACECCGRDPKAGEHGWVVGREGEDFCPECAESLAGELQRMIAALPQRIALCPQCAPEFYYPLQDGEGVRCPTMGCGLEMVVYERDVLTTPPNDRRKT